MAEWTDTRMGSFYPGQRGEGVLSVQSLWYTVHVLEITIVTSKNGFFDPGKSVGVSRSIDYHASILFFFFLLGMLWLEQGWADH